MCLSGDLDISALEQAFSEIVRRHELLRTSFVSENGNPRQIIHPAITLKLEIVDLQQEVEAERETKLQQLINEKASTPFKLEVAPLVRCSLLQLEAQEYVLLVTMHHIISDGWSMGILIKELSSLYPAFVRGKASPLEELPIQYADFAVWQREWLSGDNFKRSLNYWKKSLEGAPQLLQLPTDTPRPAIQSYRGATQYFSLSNELTKKLQYLSQKSGSSLFMTLLAAFNILLSRYSGQSDIVVGTPVAGRNRSEIENLIGFFINTVVLRSDLSGNPSFRELLQRVRSTDRTAGYQRRY